MTPRRAVSALLAVLAATMLVTGSFGFTGVSAERGVSVNVVESENAYVGVSVCEKSNGNENGNASNKVRVNVTNQFSDEFAVREITLGESEESAWVKESTGDPIPPGESRTFEVKALGHDELTVDVTDGLDASVTVDVDEEKCPNSGEGPDGNRTDGQNAGGTPTPTAEPTETPTATATPEPTEQPTETPTPEGNETDGE